MDIIQEIKSAIIENRKIKDCSMENATAVIGTAIISVMNLRGQNFDDGRSGGAAAVTYRFMNSSLRELYIGEVDVALTQGCLNNPSEFPSPAVYLKWLKEYSRSEIREKARAEVEEETQGASGSTFDEQKYISYLIYFEEEYHKTGRRGVVESCDAAIYDYLCQRHIIKQRPADNTLKAMSKEYIPDPTSNIGKIYIPFRNEKERERCRLEKGKSVALFNFLDSLQYEHTTLKELLTA